MRIFTLLFGNRFSFCISLYVSYVGQTTIHSLSTSIRLNIEVKENRVKGRGDKGRRGGGTVQHPPVTNDLLLSSPLKSLNTFQWRYYCTCVKTLPHTFIIAPYEPKTHCFKIQFWQPNVDKRNVLKLQVFGLHEAFKWYIKYFHFNNLIKDFVVL